MNVIALLPSPIPSARTLGRLWLTALAVLAALGVAVAVPSIGSALAGDSHAGSTMPAPVPAPAAAVSEGLRSVVGSSLGGAGLAQTYADDGGLHVHEVSDPSTTWSLVPVTLGRAGAPAAVLHGAAPTVIGKTTSFAMGPLTSWYRSSASGVEQGFTVASRPAGYGSPLVIALRSSGSLEPSGVGTSLVVRDRASTDVLSYGSLIVTDATGRLVPSHLAATAGGVRIVVDDARAVYPLRIDPWTQQAELTAPDGTTGDYFGTSVAISGDGSTAIVGADNATVAGLASAGKAYVYTDQGGTWTQQAELTEAVPGLFAFFGHSVSLSSNGNIALVSAFGLKVGSNFSQGAVDVFTRTGTSWSQQTQLTAGNGQMCDELGSSVALSASGTVALLGADGIGGCANHVGGAYVFTETGNSWAQSTELTSGTVTPDEFGYSVALSGDASTALIGAPFSLSQQGEAYTFTGAGFATKTAIADPHNHANDFFAGSVALSSTGAVALVSITENSLSQCAFVFSGAGYASHVSLISPFGSSTSVALSASGSVALVGDSSNVGGTYAFSGAGYVTRTALAPSSTSVNPIGPYFGSVIGLSSDGATMISGAAGQTVGGNVNQGAAYVMATSPTTPTPATVGFWLAGANGVVKAFGQAALYGSASSLHLNAPIVGIAGTDDGLGYWLVGADGGVFAYGDAGFHGSAGSLHLNAPIVDIVPTANDGGYWLVGSDGGVFAYGNAGFYGSAGSLHLNAPVVGMAGTVASGGYWLVGADGGVFAYGNAGFHGSLVGSHLSAPVTGIAGTVNSGGYWLVGTNGAVYPLGNAVTYGSAAGSHLNAPVDGVATTADGAGYSLVAKDGGLFAYGDSGFYGSGVGQFPGTTVVGIAPSDQG